MITVTDNYFFGAAFKHKSSSDIIKPEELLKKQKNEQLYITNNTTIMVSIKSHTLLLEIIKLLLELKIERIYIYIYSINEMAIELTASGIIILAGKLRPQKIIDIISQTQQKKQVLPIVKMTKITQREWEILFFLFQGLDNKMISTLLSMSEQAISCRFNLICNKLKTPQENRPKKIKTLEILFTIHHFQKSKQES